MPTILQARIQQYVNHELPEVQAGFRKGRGTRDQIANIFWIMRNTGLDEAQAGIKRLPGEISITSDMQMIPPLWQKVKKN